MCTAGTGNELLEVSDQGQFQVTTGPEVVHKSDIVDKGPQCTDSKTLTHRGEMPWAQLTCS